MYWTTATCKVSQNNLYVHLPVFFQMFNYGTQTHAIKEKVLLLHYTYSRESEHTYHRYFTALQRAAIWQLRFGHTDTCIQ